MKLRAALSVMAIMLPGWAAWSQDAPKTEIAIDYSYVRFAAIDYHVTHPFDFYRAYDLNGGGGSAVFDFGKFFGLKAEFQAMAAGRAASFSPPVTRLFPRAVRPVCKATCSPTCSVPRSASVTAFFVPTPTAWWVAPTAMSMATPIAC